MKKILKITAAILVLLLIFFVGLFKYRQYEGNQISIPKNATSVVKVNVDEVLKSLAANMIANPAFYLKSGKKKESTTGAEKLRSGLKIPASLYFYTLKNQPKMALFSRFEIKEVSAFEAFLTNTFGFKTLKKQNGIIFAGLELGHVMVCYNDKAVAFVFSNEVSNFDAILIEILEGRNAIKIGDSKFNPLKNSTSHLAYIDDKNNISANFNTGEIDFSADFPTQAIIPAAKPSHRKFSQQSTARFWLDADLSKMPNKTYQFDNISVAHDSLLKYYKGYLDFEWTNTTQQTDSIITYEYNDDFEKTEKVTLQKRSVPNLIVNIKADAKGLKHYLSQKQIINPDGGTLNKTVFPLYKVFTGSDDNYLQLVTSKNIKTDQTQILTNEFLFLNVDCRKLNIPFNIPILTPRLKRFKQLEIKGKAMNAQKIQLKGKITFLNEEINSLYQLLTDF